MEFLVALATERLTLRRVHLLEFCNRIVAAAASEESAVLVAQYIIGRENLMADWRFAPILLPLRAIQPHQ
ncbi:hypothetical protein [Paraburkholderia lycopersici]|uniref:hypothetical protein n=1 Tax=Paraburkholderia lycopersici TaxID=416944 RepID=UPI000B81DAD1|nr:hypothetical protein [Paraburkholderia lycopersici]